VSTRPTSPARIVADGYDRIADRYRAWSIAGPTRLAYLRRLLALLPDHSDVLELGCGAGEPVARQLNEHHRVIGVDLSAEQIDRARAGEPDAEFIVGDMTEVDFPPRSFDAVAAFYAVTHVPRTKHAGLLARIARWLRPGGVLLVTMGASDCPGVVEDDWLGVPMYFSHFDAPTNRAIVERAGLVIESDEIVTDDEDGKPAAFQWIIARRPEVAPAG
jgi:SAM-dependent methyltransferase